MAWLKNLSLKKSFFLLTLCGLLISLLLLTLLWQVCHTLAAQYPSGGIVFNTDGTMTRIPNPTPEEMQILRFLWNIPVLGCIIFPILGLSAASALFFRWKLQPPIAVLLDGTQRIQKHDLDFVIPEIASDELGQVCAAFETMRAKLLQTNQQLWRQTEERRRLNAAFAHDLRNPLTVLKGTVKLMRRQPPDETTLNRLESYTTRLEQYVEAMSSIQRLEQMPVKINSVTASELHAELSETARLLAPGLKISFSTANFAEIQLDKALFLTVAENLISNATRFAQNELKISLKLENKFLSLTVADDGAGYPPILLKNGPQPFSHTDQTTPHLGMGLYICQTLCKRHGGWLTLQNHQNQAINQSTGAQAIAVFKIFSEMSIF